MLETAIIPEKASKIEIIIDLTDTSNFEWNLPKLPLTLKKKNKQKSTPKIFLWV